MKKLYNLIYTLCWCFLCWEVMIHLPFFDFSNESKPSASVMPDYMIWLFAMLIYLCLFFLIYAILKRTTRRGLKVIAVTVRGTFTAAVLLLGAVLFCSLSDSFSYTDKILAGLAVLSFILLFVVLYMLSRRKIHSEGGIMWATTLIVTVAVGLTFWVPDMWGLGISDIGFSLGEDLLSYYTGQLSLTFITISVMSVLSDKSVVIYWENVAEAKLIRPLLGSFASYTAYSVAATVGAGISVILNKPLAFCVFFAVNVVVLILLTLTMVDVYYGRERKKSSRAELLRRVTREYRIAKADGDPSQGAEYIDLMYNLRHHLHKEIEEHNIPYIREVAELYGGNLDCFATEEGAYIKSLLGTVEADVGIMMIDGIEHRVAALSQRHSSVNALANGSWMEDRQLWAALANSRVLMELAVDEASAEKLMRAVLDRCSLLVEDIASNSIPIYMQSARGYKTGMRLAHVKSRNVIRALDKFFDTVFGREEFKKAQMPVRSTPALQFLINLIFIVSFLKERVDEGTWRLAFGHHAVHELMRYFDDMGLSHDDILNLRQ